jgi:glycosyltransferase involved in cell wall biosynthesis
MTANVVILTGSHLCHNPRVIKEGETIAESGYEVLILGGWSDPILKERDKKLLKSLRVKFSAVMDNTERTIPRLRARMRNKLGSITHRISGLNNRWQLGHAYANLRRAAFHQKADLYIAHSEPAMAVAVDLLRFGERVAVDMEDWYSEDLLPEARWKRPIDLLRSLEGELLTRGAYASCPSHVMSEALVRQFGCPPPVAIYNAFPWFERRSLDGKLKDRRDREVPSIHWFSQTLGPGRGLEDLVSALPLISYPVNIHFRGIATPSFETWLGNCLPEFWRSRIFIHGLVPNDELLSRIAEHDIGFAGEMKYCRSRDLTVTNKILQYLLAGLAVVASDTLGQREIAEQAPDAVLLYPAGNAAALAARINTLLSRPEMMQCAKSNALRAAETLFCWELEQNVLMARIRSVLHRKGTTPH